MHKSCCLAFTRLACSTVLQTQWLVIDAFSQNNGELLMCLSEILRFSLAVVIRPAMS